jgi:hypothetical protein
MTLGGGFLKNPERRFLLELAEKLGRTLQELLYGSDTFVPITSAEIVEWAALHKLRAYEAEQASKRRR